MPLCLTNNVFIFEKQIPIININVEKEYDDFLSSVIIPIYNLPPYTKEYIIVGTKEYLQNSSLIRILYYLFHKKNPKTNKWLFNIWPCSIEFIESKYGLNYLISYLCKQPTSLEAFLTLYILQQGYIGLHNNVIRTRTTLHQSINTDINIAVNQFKIFLYITYKINIDFCKYVLTIIYNQLQEELTNYKLNKKVSANHLYKELVAYISDAYVSNIDLKQKNLSYKEN